MSSSDNKGKNNPNKIRTGYLVNILFLCAIILGILALCVILIFKLRSANKNLTALNDRIDAVEGEKDKLYTEEELSSEVDAAKKSSTSKERTGMLQQIQTSLESGESTTTMLRRLFPDDLVVRNGEKYYFYPIQENVATSTFTADDFALDEDGRMQYKGSDSSVKTSQGIDVSGDSGEIDWEKVAADDVDFSFVKIGGRDKDGNLTADTAYRTNITGSSENGIKTGVYYRLFCNSDDEAIEDADWLIEKLDGVSEYIDGPVAIVVSMPAGDDRTTGQSRSQWTSRLLTVIDKVREAGYDPVVMASVTTYTMMLDLTELEDEVKWVSDHGNSIYYPYRFTYWQYSSGGKVDGINGKVNLDLSVTEPDR